MISLRNRRQNLTEQQKNKINEIKEALNNNDIYTLRQLSRTEGGFVTSELRKLCWPFLLHVDVSDIRINEKKDIIQYIENEISSSSNKSEIKSDIENENINVVNDNSLNSNTQDEVDNTEDIDSTEKQINEIEEELIKKTDNTVETNDEGTNQNNNNDTISTIEDEIINEKIEKPEINEQDKKIEQEEKIINENSTENIETKIKNENIEQQQESPEIIEPIENNEKLEKEEETTKNIETEIKNEEIKQKESTENEKEKEKESNDIEKIDIKSELNNNNEKVADDYDIENKNEIELIKKENENKEIAHEFEENSESKDDFNSETLKDDEINENIESITQENMIIASQSGNDDTYLERESLDKKENLSETSDNEDYTKNNHSDDESDDVLFKGDINIHAGEIHPSHFKDNGENKEIFDNSSNESINKINDEGMDEESESKKCVAKDIILDSDDDPERMDKLKQIEDESKYRDKRQIMKDVNRAFVHFPKGLKAKEKTVKQIELSRVILYSLKDHSYLHYYQGYHDICSLLLLVLGEDIATSCAEILALYWLREYMKETLEPTLEVMSFLYPILKYADPKIYKLVYNNMVPPYFSISWVITWCIHDLRDTSEMERLFDFFISNNPIMPIYFAAAVILTQKEKLYNRFPQILDDNASENEEDENDPETSMPNFSVVHQFLTHLLPIATTQDKNVTVDSAIELAWSLYEQYPLKFLMKKESIKLNPLCCVKRYFDDCEKVLPNQPFNKEEIIKLLKKEEELNLKLAMASPTTKDDHFKKIQEKADIIGKYLSQRITLLTIATTLILVTAIILTHEFSKTYYM